jgi:tellurite resistance protein TerC
MESYVGYGILGVIVLALMAFDLYSHRSEKEISVKSAALWSVFYIGAALGFATYLNFAYSTEWAQLFLTGYALEKVLAIDNLFAFMIIFGAFGIASKYQHRILYWGILGAIVFRGIFVALGTTFTAILGPWALLIFGLIIGWTAFKMLTKKEEDTDEATDYDKMWYIRWTKKILPVTSNTNGSKFFLKEPNAAGKMAWFATPMFICLVAIEMTDIVFAFDSVPAVIAVTKEPYLVFSAMLFAILGLRSLYFVLEALRRILTKLETMVIVILAYIAGKLTVQAGSELLHHHFNIGQPIHIDPMWSLGIVMTLLTAGVVWSLFTKPEAEATT